MQTHQTLRFIAGSLLAASALLPVGCQSLSGHDWNSASRMAEERVGHSLALVKIHQQQDQGQRIVYQGMTLNMGAMMPPPEYTGLILTTNGHVLIQDVLKADSQDRIEVWVGNSSYPARLVKADESLGMSIIKLETADHFAPLSLDKAADLNRGEGAMALVPTGEETDYQRFLTVTSCRGEIGGRYRRFALMGVTRDSRGSLLLNGDGVPVGIVGIGDAISVVDVRDDLMDFLAEATGAHSATDEEKQKGWIGVFLDPINKDLAKSRGLPEGGLWVRNVDSSAPGAAAGLHEGDLIVALNSQPLKFTGQRAKDFFMKSLRPKPGNPFTLTVQRAGSLLDLHGVVAKRPEPITVRAEDIGVTVQSITDSDKFSENLATRDGVRITELMRGSAAATGSTMNRTPLMVGDVITELNRQATPDMEAFSKALDVMRRNKVMNVLVEFKRGQATGYAGLNLKIGEKGNGGRQ